MLLVVSLFGDSTGDKNMNCTRAVIKKKKKNCTPAVLVFSDCLEILGVIFLQTGFGLRSGDYKHIKGVLSLLSVQVQGAEDTEPVSSFSSLCPSRRQVLDLEKNHLLRDYTSVLSNHSRQDFFFHILSSTIFI